MPHLIIIAGPNGSGKTTTAPALLQNAAQVDDFVNADTIARGLSAFQPEKTSIQAGRVMLSRIHLLAKEKSNFAFETTLASRTFAPWINTLKRQDYEFHLIFLWLKTPELAISRVRERIKMGGHNVPEYIIQRRYHAGLKNFFNLYLSISNSWQFYDNTNVEGLTLIASKKDDSTIIQNENIWKKLLETYDEK